MCRLGGRSRRLTDHPNGVLVHEVSQHETHHLERYTCTAVFEHLRIAALDARTSQVSLVRTADPPRRAVQSKVRTLRRAKLLMWTVSALSFVGWSPPTAGWAPPPNWPMRLRNCASTVARAGSVSHVQAACCARESLGSPYWLAVLCVYVRMAEANRVSDRASDSKLASRHRLAPPTHHNSDSASEGWLSRSRRIGASVRPAFTAPSATPSRARLILSFSSDNHSRPGREPRFHNRRLGVRSPAGQATPERPRADQLHRADHRPVGIRRSRG